jgi:hypothetical protein
MALCSLCWIVHGEARECVESSMVIFGFVGDVAVHFGGMRLGLVCLGAALDARYGKRDTGVTYAISVRRSQMLIRDEFDLPHVSFHIAWSDIHGGLACFADSCWGAQKPLRLRLCQAFRTHPRLVWVDI